VPLIILSVVIVIHLAQRCCEGYTIGVDKQTERHKSGILGQLAEFVKLKCVFVICMEPVDQQLL